MFIPSLHLPSALSEEPASTLASLVDKLNSIYNPTQTTIFLDSLHRKLDQEEASPDGFEVEFLRNWLGRFISFATKRVGSGEGNLEGDEDVWSALVDESASLLSALSGESGALVHPLFLDFRVASRPASSFQLTIPSLAPATGPKTYRYQLPPPYDSPPLLIHETTLLSSSTGHRTWEAGIILSHLLCTETGEFFPYPSPKVNKPLLRVLELGSGTGLLGFTAAAVLATFEGRATEVTLSDYEDLVLVNLRHNLETNSFLRSRDGEHTIEAVALDWSTFVSPSERTRRRKERYDTIMGSDLVFESDHLPWLIATVSALLRFPNEEEEEELEPTFHLIIPLRRTHVAETTAFDEWFDATRERVDEGLEDSETGKRWRLATGEKRIVRGSNIGFGRTYGRGSGSRAGVSEREEEEGWFSIYWIRWKLID